MQIQHAGRTHYLGSWQADQKAEALGVAKAAGEARDSGQLDKHLTRRSSLHAGVTWSKMMQKCSGYLTHNMFLRTSGKKDNISIYNDLAIYNILRDLVSTTALDRCNKSHSFVFKEGPQPVYKDMTGPP